MTTNNQRSSWEQELHRAKKDYSITVRPYTTSLVELENAFQAGADWERERSKKLVEKLKQIAEKNPSIVDRYEAADMALEFSVIAEEAIAEYEGKQA